MTIRTVHRIAFALVTCASAAVLAACAPQAELVKTRTDMNELRDDVKTTKAAMQRLDRELAGLQKKLDALEANVKGTTDTEKVMADYGAKSDQLTTDIQLLQGKLEENNFHIAEVSQKLDDRAVKIAELSARLDELEAKLKSGGTSTTPAGQGSAPKATQKTIEPSDAYRQAKSDYDKGNYDLALAGFQNYISQFPSASQADKAQYWLGESYYSKKEWSKAIEAFGKVLSGYPRSDKVAGAKLKIGLCYLNERNHEKAKEYLHKVIKDHPGSNEAEIAKDRLSRMGK